MEVWRVDQTERPEVISKQTLTTALVLHIALFLGFYLYSVVNFREEEKIIPIDLTVVVNENLDGKENEPPPLDDPPPPPKPQPKPKPKVAKVKKPDPPKALEQIVTNIVAKVDKKEEKKEKEPPKKKDEPKKEEPPKKTKAELRKERLEAMRKSATVSKKRVEIKVKGPSGDGRTAKKTLSNAEIMKLLNMGYKPGTTTQLASSTAQLGYSLIKQAMESKWDTPPWTDTLKPMTIRLWFGGGGRVVRWKLESSSGDAHVDQTIKTAASRVGSIPALPTEFIEQFKSQGVPVRFTVRPQ